MPAEGYGPVETWKANPRSSPYPVAASLNSQGYALNPGSPICAYYQKTGSCKFGASCRFDHPEDQAGGSLNSFGYPLNEGQPDCAFFMKSGTCKFGATCKYNHPEGVAMGPAPVRSEGQGQTFTVWGNGGEASRGLNTAGYPLNPGAADCAFFMKTGACKYAGSCRFNHPEGVATVPAGSPPSGQGAFNNGQARTGGKGGSGSLNSAGYPLNPGSPDCAFFMKTGNCKFGSTCRFNHPEGVATVMAEANGPAGGPAGGRVAAAQAIADMDEMDAFAEAMTGGDDLEAELMQVDAAGGPNLNSGGFPFNPGSPDCSFYLKTGTCKFGATCKFNHPEGVTASAGGQQNAVNGSATTALNSAGFPLHPGSPDCAFYMKTGSCKFGATCRFNHPEGVTGSQGGATNNATWGEGGNFNSMGYPLNPAQIDCAFYMKTGSCKFGGTCRYNHPEGVATTPAGAPAPTNAPAITWGAGGGKGGGAGKGPIGAAPEGNLNSMGFPLNPTQIDCAFYMKTGNCKFGVTCRFNHPEGVTPAPTGGASATPAVGYGTPRGGGEAANLNSGGFPLNPGQPDCAFYMRTGTCKFGATCRFNHPEDALGGGGGQANASPSAAGEFEAEFNDLIGQGGATPSGSRRPTGHDPNASAESVGGSELPLRAHTKACHNYLKTGTCQFGSECMWNHPPNMKPEVDRDNLNWCGYPINAGQQECTFYLKTGICKFGATCFKAHPDREGGEAQVLGQVVPPRVRPTEQAQPGNGSYAQRPGEPYCSFFLKTGTCKFGTTCKFDHPAELAGTGGGGGLSLNSLGYPMRPGGTICAFYQKTGQCKFGATCRFDHPELEGGMTFQQAVEVSVAAAEINANLGGDAFQADEAAEFDSLLASTEGTAWS